MKNIVTTFIEKFRTEHRHRRRIAAVMLPLGLVVASGVVWELRSTGIAMSNETYCGVEEHTHTAACFEDRLTCGLEESDDTASHVHTDACYETQQVLTCGLEESAPVEGHSHTDACYETQVSYVCGQEEDAEHTHTEACQQTEQILTCTLEEQEGSAGHTHTDACYEMVTELTCMQEEGAPEEGHTHSASCYAKVLTCEVEEHTHGMSCMTDETADWEEADDWEASLPQLSGNWAEDVTAVAESQKGYQESTENYVLSEDGRTHRGCTRYGLWYGNAYGDWSAMFAAFVYHYAGVPETVFPQASGMYAWSAALSGQQLYHDEADYQPEMADLAFLDLDGDGSAEHAGIVTQASDTTVTMLVGDLDDQVKEMTCDIHDQSVCGYGALPEQNGTGRKNAAQDSLIETEMAEGDTTDAVFSLEPESESETDAEAEADAETETETATETESLEEAVTESISETADIENVETELTETEEDPVTVTFGYDAADFAEGVAPVSQVYTVTAGKSLAEAIDSEGNTVAGLPEAHEADQQTFDGWYTLNADTDEAQRAELSTVITTDTYFTANYIPDGYILTIHDIAPEGSGEEDHIQQLVTKEGDMVADALAEFTMDDGVAAADCTWSEAPDGEQALNLSQEITEDMDIYTSRYAIELVLPEESITEEIETETENSLRLSQLLGVMDAHAAGIVSIKDNVISIEYRDGYVFTAADFVIDGVDYTQYQWTSNGAAFDLGSLIGNTLTGNLTLTKGALKNGAVETKKGNVHFMACFDGSWQEMSVQNVEGYRFGNTGNRFYIPAAVLESAYGSLIMQNGVAFNASLVTQGSGMFPHANGQGGTIWNDAKAIKRYQIVYLPVQNGNVNNTYVYFTPDNANRNGVAKENAISDQNKFYSVKAMNANQVLSEDTVLPDVVYVQKDGTYTVALPAVDKEGNDIKWVTIGDIQSSTSTGSDDSQVNVTVSMVTGDVLLLPMPDGSEPYALVAYDLNLPKNPTDKEYGTPKIPGYNGPFTISDDSYEAAAITPSSYLYGIGGSNTVYQGRAKFEGWELYVDGALRTDLGVIHPDDTLSMEAFRGKVVTLKGKWTTEDSGTGFQNNAMVNFYVALTAVSEGTTSWSAQTNASYFTNSVYATPAGITGKDADEKKLYYKYTDSPAQDYILGGNNPWDKEKKVENPQNYLGSDLKSTYDLLKKKLENGYVSPKDEESVFRVDFPSDEEVLRNVRALVRQGGAKGTIMLNGRKITEDELNTDNFTILWYVFKWDHQDGYHIDGILTCKTSKLIVQKTITGHKDKIPENFAISVKGQNGVIHSKDVELTLDPNSFQSYDEATNTYTWELDADQYYKYTLQEKNYQPIDDEAFTVTAQKRIANSLDEVNGNALNTGGWQGYNSETLTVIPKGTGTAGLTTASFMNTYTAPGTIILRKYDGDTNGLMGDVSFSYQKDGEQGFKLYPNGQAGYYTYDINEASSTEPVGEITTDSSGQAYLYMQTGTYNFTEIPVDGYDAAGEINVVLEPENSNPKMPMIRNGTEKTDEKGRPVYRKLGSRILGVYNYSHKVSLTATKQWLDGENKPVSIALKRNGSVIENVNFDTFTDNQASKTYDDISLYADGKLAEYTLQETRLGDFLYSDEFTGGYQYYDVTPGKAHYYDAEGREIIDTANAEAMARVTSIQIRIDNKRASGELEIKKVDQDSQVLPGAKVALYAESSYSTDANGTATLSGSALKEAVSDENGTISFGVMTAGTYYVKETQAPENYTGSEEIYQLIFGKTTTLKCWDSSSESWVAVLDNAIVNYSQTADVTIRKVDNANTFLPGAVFKLQQESKGSYVDVKDAIAITESEGFTLHDLKAGKYQLIETAAPDGYYKMTAPISFTISGGAVHYEGERSDVAFSSDTEGNGTFTVTNYSGSELPYTGGTGTLPYALSGLICIMAALLLSIVSRRQREGRFIG